MRAGLASVPHAGELLGPEHIREALNHLAPHRLGHGVRAAEDAALLDELVRRGITLEVCPGSNVSLGVYEQPHDVPLRRLLEAGTRIALGADDPLLFGTRLVAQYESARSVHRLDDTALAGLARGSIEGSRAPQERKTAMLAGVDAWLAACPPRIPGCPT